MHRYIEPPLICMVTHLKNNTRMEFNTTPGTRFVDKFVSAKKVNREDINTALQTSESENILLGPGLPLCSREVLMQYMKSQDTI